MLLRQYPKCFVALYTIRPSELSLYFITWRFLVCVRPAFAFIKGGWIIKRVLVCWRKWVFGVFCLAAVWVFWHAVVWHVKGLVGTFAAAGLSCIVVRSLVVGVVIFAALDMHGDYSGTGVTSQLSEVEKYRYSQHNSDT